MNKKEVYQDKKGNIPEYSVEQIGQAVRGLLEGSFDYIRVRGEVAEVLIAKSGHLYMTLRDTEKENTVIKIVCWRSRVMRLGHSPERGQDVTVTGRLTAYTGSSHYQLDMQAIELSGIGALLQKYEALKKRLYEEGMFDESRKKPLPLLPRRIGVVTSPFGAVIRDILHRVSDRFPCHVIVWPVAVQGDGSVEQIVEAINGFNNCPEEWEPDVIIVARGGGSFQDLWGFNDERILRAAAGSRIPLVSAIGHETDTPLLDFVADWRSPTPTAAAEQVLPVRQDLAATLSEARASMERMVARCVHDGRQNVANQRDKMGRVVRRLREIQQNMDMSSMRLARAIEKQQDQWRNKIARMRLTSPRQTWRMRKQRMQTASRAMVRAMKQFLALRREQGSNISTRFTTLRPYGIELQRQSLAQASQSLEHLSHERQLRRGYALIFDQEGAVVRNVDGIRDGAEIRALLACKQEIIAHVIRTKKDTHVEA